MDEEKYKIFGHKGKIDTVVSNTFCGYRNGDLVRGYYFRSDDELNDIDGILSGIYGAETRLSTIAIAFDGFSNCLCRDFPVFDTKEHLIKFIKYLQKIERNPMSVKYERHKRKRLKLFY